MNLNQTRGNKTFESGTTLKRIILWKDFSFELIKWHHFSDSNWCITFDVWNFDHSIFIYQANIHFKFKIVDLSNFKYFYKNDHSFFIFFLKLTFLFQC